MGVVAPNAIGLPSFLDALRNGRSGIAYHASLEELGFGCWVGGVPPLETVDLTQYLTPIEQKSYHATGILYGLVAGMDAWTDAGLAIPEKDAPADWDSGLVFGAGLAGAEVVRNAAYLIDEGKVRRLGSTTVPQVMSSGISAHLGGRLGLGNVVTTNASACSTGTESLLLGMDRIRAGRARRVLCGACDSGGPYVWGGFDAMRVLNRKMNDRPEQASRPLSASAAGFVPGAGAGALVLENLDSARARGARIYAELAGGALNSGGQRQGGTMTAPSPQGIRRCLEQAYADAGMEPAQLDAISGHLTGTLFDPREVEQWCASLGRSGADFPYLHALKSMIGHCLSAAGAIESVAGVLQLFHGFLHPNLNCEDLHPEIALRVDSSRIPKSTQPADLQYLAKSSFGFGDVNSCVIFKKFSEHHD